MNERWKTIPTFPDYEASTMGRIRRKTKTHGAISGQILKPQLSNHLPPRYVVGVYRLRKQFRKTVHSLILETFIRVRPFKKECNHKDGNRFNNCLTNLEWVSRSENIQHGIRHGLFPGNPKLNMKQVREIRALLSTESHNMDNLAAKYNVSQSVISNIRMSKTWKDSNYIPPTKRYPRHQKSS